MVIVHVGNVHGCHNATSSKMRPRSIAEERLPVVITIVIIRLLEGLRSMSSDFFGVFLPARLVAYLIARLSLREACIIGRQAFRSGERLVAQLFKASIIHRRLYLFPDR